MMRGPDPVPFRQWWQDKHRPRHHPRIADDQYRIPGRAVVEGLLGMIPGVGEAMDAREVGMGLLTGDRSRAAFGAAGLLLPFAGGTTLRRVLGRAGELGEEAGGSYRGLHSAPTADGGVPAHDLTQMWPEDIYGDPKLVAQYYGHGGASSAMDRMTARKLAAMRGRPDDMVTVYRAVPEDLADAEINPGDWVTPNVQYALSHGNGPLGGKFRIIERQVPVRELFTDGNSIHEFGWDPR